MCVVPGCGRIAAKKCHKCESHRDDELCAWPLCPFVNVDDGDKFCPYHECAVPACQEARWYDHASCYCHDHHIVPPTRPTPAAAPADDAPADDAVADDAAAAFAPADDVPAGPEADAIEEDDADDDAAVIAVAI